jgi:hypothetical protein
MPVQFTVGWGQFGAAIGGIGALGVAAFGIVESVGKAFAFSLSTGPRRRSVSGINRHIHFGLPYVGLGVVKQMVQPLEEALACAYGPDYLEVIAQQYRSDRGDGSAPDTIRQGVRLGLPYLDPKIAAAVIGSVWKMEPGYAAELAQALQAAPPAVAPPPPPPPGPQAAPAPAPVVSTGQLLAGRFAAALDARVTAAFELADERYETVAKTLAAAASVTLALLFNYGLGQPLHWAVALGVGIIAVPVAPVAKDLSTSLQNALTAFKSIAGKS